MQDLNDLVKLSHAVGEPMDYTQGGGGNTSVKTAGGIMPIKASGMFLRDMTEKDGFAAVRYDKVLDYMNSVERGVAGKDYNTEINAVAMDNIVNINGEPARRPSCEVGFHSVLKKYVAHTHSVYANVFTCSENGLEDGCAILEKAGMPSAGVPALAPGYYLTEYMEGILKERPDVQIFLLKNHGIVAHADDVDECIELHKKANDALIAALSLSSFPICSVRKVPNGFVSNTPWLREKFSNKAVFDMVFGAPLYPDQIVYTQHPENFEYKGPDTVYITDSEKQAQAIEETLCGVCYVLTEILRAGRDITFMSGENIAYVSNWDVEKYRRDLLK